MKYLIPFWLFAIAGGLVSGCGDSDCHSQPALSIVFVGNSYTSGNNVPKLVQDIACDKNINLEVTSLAPGGANFGSHVKKHHSDEFIRKKRWDYIVLQNQSVTPSRTKERNLGYSVPKARLLVDAAKRRNSDVQVVYFVTWGREKGGVYCRYDSSCSFDEHTQALLDGYTEYAKATGGKLAKVGSAWRYVVDDENAPFDSGNLWGGDGSHADRLGSFLTAAVIVAEAFDLSPIGASIPEGITKEDGDYVLQVAHDIARK